MIMIKINDSNNNDTHSKNNIQINRYKWNGNSRMVGWCLELLVATKSTSLRLRSLCSQHASGPGKSQAGAEFLVFFLVKGGNKSIDSNTQSFLVNWLISPLFASSGEARQRDGSVPSHGVSASHPPAAHVRGALVIWSWRFETIPMEDLRIYWVVMVVFV